EESLMLELAEKYKKSLTLELMENLITQKLDKVFYDDLGNIVTAKYESDYFLDYLLDDFEYDFEHYDCLDEYDNYDDYFNSFLNYKLEKWIDGFSAIDDDDLDFCPICKEFWYDMEEDCGHYTATMIKYYRLKNGWSLRDLAEKLGYKYHNTVAAWENG